MEDVAVMGPAAILARLPKILRRIHGTAAAAVAAEPDALVIIDSPEFTHPIAKRMRRRSPEIPIIDYVSPSVWAWRPGRARKMRALCRPRAGAAAVRAGGASAARRAALHLRRPSPDRAPAVDRRARHRAAGRSASALPPDTALLVVLPGSRTSEVKRLMQPFGETLSRLIERGRKFEVVMPVVESVRGLIEQHLPAWPKQPHLLEGEEDKFRAFKLARAALAASGTVTLELGAGRHADGRRLQGRCGDRRRRCGR